MRTLLISTFLFMVPLPSLTGCGDDGPVRIDDQVTAEIRQEDETILDEESEL